MFKNKQKESPALPEGGKVKRGLVFSVKRYSGVLFLFSRNAGFSYFISLPSVRGFWSL
jgi:hypothetical protein